MHQDLGNFFTSYYQNHGRDYPWRKKGLSRYHLLVTEILLKRTKSEKVAELWSSFFSRFPDIASLHFVEQRELAKVLEPLGLHNSRSIQLKQLARQVLEDHGGNIPTNLRGLPGVGQYVSGAIDMMLGDFSYLPQDVNVHRVLGRLEFDPQLDLASYENLLEVTAPRQLLLGLLDFASEVCLPQNPKCNECPLASQCDFVKSAVRLEFSYELVTGAAQVVVLSAGQYRVLKRDGEINLKTRGRTNITSWVYVQKPLSVLIGRGRLINNVLELSSPFSKQVHLTEIRVLTPLFSVRAPITWVWSRDEFKAMIWELTDLEQ